MREKSSGCGKLGWKENAIGVHRGLVLWRGWFAPHPSRAVPGPPSPEGKASSGGIMHLAENDAVVPLAIVSGAQKQNPQPYGCGPCNKKRGEENEKDEEIIFDLPLLYQSNVKKKSG